MNKLLLLFAFVALFGCKVTKESQGSESKEEMYTKEQVDSAVKASVVIVQKRMDERLRQQQSSVQFYQNDSKSKQRFLDALRKDSTFTAYQLKELANRLEWEMNQICEPETKIVYRPDGSAEVLTSNIAGLNLQLTDWQKKSDSFAVEYENEKSKRMAAENKYELLSSEFSSKTKTRFLSMWWLWYLLGCLTTLVTMIMYYKNKK